MATSVGNSAETADASGSWAKSLFDDYRQTASLEELRLSGSWLCTGRQYFAGAIMPLSAGRTRILMIEGELFRIDDRSQELSEFVDGTIEVKADTIPKRITTTSWPRRSLGVYRLAGDELTIQWAPSGQTTAGLTRASNVGAIAGRGYFLETYKRLPEDNSAKNRWIKSLEKQYPKQFRTSEKFKRLPSNEERPWVVSRINPSDRRIHDVRLGYFGRTLDGKWIHNLVGSSFVDDRGRRGLRSTTFAPRISSFAVTSQLGIHARHTSLPPGEYLFYLAEGNYFVYQSLKVTAGTTAELEFELDPSKTQRVLFTDFEPSKLSNIKVMIAPKPIEHFDVKFELLRSYVACNLEFSEIVGDTLVMDGLAPGRYKVFLRKRPVQEFQVSVEKDTVVSLAIED